MCCVFRIVSSLEAEASALSSVASSQDSLHKQPKKKGIKSSIGRLFGKKEKGRLAHLAHRHVMVDPQGESTYGGVIESTCNSLQTSFVEAASLICCVPRLLPATMMDPDAAGQDMSLGKLGTQAEKDRRLKKK